MNSIMNHQRRQHISRQIELCVLPRDRRDVGATQNDVYGVFGLRDDDGAPPG